MSLVLAALLTAGSTAPVGLPACSWNRPGHNPFMGDVVAAIDRYPDIPAPVRDRLKARMASRSYDEIVSIRRDAIVGKARYSPEIRDMHFGSGQVCGTVNRLQWSNDAQERGLVYCEAGHCILVPTVCRNVSRITRESPAVAGTGAGGVPGGGGAGGGAGAPAAATGGGTVSAAAVSIDSGTGNEAAAPSSFVAGLEPLESAGAGIAGTRGLGGNEPSGDTGVSGISGIGGLVAAGLPVAAPMNDAVHTGSPFDVQASRVVGGASGRGGIDANPDTGGSLSGLGRGVRSGGGSALALAVPVPPVPEPGTWVLMLGGLATLAWRARRRA